MRSRTLLAVGLAAVIGLAACGSSTTTPSPASQAPASQAASAAPGSAAPESAAPESAAPLAVDPAEAVIPNVEANAEITFWTFYLSPTFDQYIKDTITRFEGTYPGVKVNWEDHQATFKDDLNNAFAAGNAPDVINLSVSEGWVSEYAGKGLLLPLDTAVPQAVKDIYFAGLWKEQLIDGVNYQFPWYQGLNVELVNKKIYEEGAGLSVADFPKTIDGLPQLCQTIKDKTGTLCDIRLTVSDLLAQMVYEGNVKVISDDGEVVHVRLTRRRRLAPDVHRHGQGRHRGQHGAHDQRRPRRAQRLRCRQRRVLCDRPQPRPNREGSERRPCTATWPWSRHRWARAASPARA